MHWLEKQHVGKQCLVMTVYRIIHLPSCARVFALLHHSHHMYNICTTYVHAGTALLLLINVLTCDTIRAKPD